MESSPLVVTMGHPIVDVLAPTEDAAVAALGLAKGTMTLVDDETSARIYGALGAATEVSGGSAANTAACLASLGAPVQFVGKIHDDGLGKVFAHDIEAIGVRYETRPAIDGPATGRCLVMVTPDAEKTMCTNLGAGETLQPSDIDVAAVASAKVLYIEGYLCGKPETTPAVERAISAARASGTLVALSGSDPAWVGLVREALWGLLDRTDILFANEQEALGLAATDDLEEAVRILGQRCPTLAVTLGAKGCVVVDSSGSVSVPAVPVDQVVDTTGAGDSFAAGFLYGSINDLGPQVSARLGVLAASEMISHLGARPLTPLADLARTAGLI